MPKSRTKRTSTKRTSTKRTSTKRTSTKKTSNKQAKDFIDDMISKVIMEKKKYNKKIKKETKDKSSLNKCHAFVKKDAETIMKRVSKQPGSMPPPPSKEMMKLIKEDDKLIYCNEKCDGFEDNFYGDKKIESNFKNNIKDGFSNIYTSDEIEHLKEQGALSGCKFLMDNGLGLRWTKK
jgi:hypothetical protein